MATRNGELLFFFFDLFSLFAKQQQQQQQQHHRENQKTPSTQLFLCLRLSPLLPLLYERYPAEERTVLAQENGDALKVF
jgi:hypothetical protein